jgi:small subunit ribosomal protein S16
LGVRNKPYYRIVAIDERKKRGGVALANLGQWFPSKNKKVIKKEKINEWLAKGAQLTNAVKKLLGE